LKSVERSNVGKTMALALDSVPKAYGGDLREVFRNPLALSGATVGCGLTVALLFALAQHAGVGAAVETEGAFEVDFQPGTLVEIGVELEASELPDKEVIPPTRAPVDHVPAEAVTDDEDAEARVEPPEQPQPEEPEENPMRDTDRKDPQLPPSKLPVPPTPFDDPPTRTVPEGDPFGDVDGWSDLKKDGDPWATAVMAALNQMPVGAFGAKMAEGTSRFQITLCKDGSVKTVQKKGGTLEAVDQARVADAVRSLDLPKPPASVARNMEGQCAKIAYTFVWSNGAVR